MFVGGLPENATEELIREVFEGCGEIAAIRKSKKNFCHIRFAQQPTVEAALRLSGYRIRIGASTDKKDSGKIHVDFAEARDDLHDWECQQRLLAREERHCRLPQGAPPPSPPPVAHYSEHEAALLADRLRGEAAPPSFSGSDTELQDVHVHTHTRAHLNDNAAEQSELEHLMSSKLLQPPLRKHPIRREEEKKKKKKKEQLIEQQITDAQRSSERLTV